MIIFLGPITTLALVSEDCDFGTLKLNDFDWTKLGNSVLT